MTSPFCHVNDAYGKSFKIIISYNTLKTNYWHDWSALDFTPSLIDQQNPAVICSTADVERKKGKTEKHLHGLTV